MTEYLGWFANLFLIIGVFFVNPKTKWPFIYTIIGESIWLYVCLKIPRWDMAFICLVFAVLALRNYFKWEDSLP